MSELIGTYDPLFVTISIAVAIISSFVALAAVPRIHCSSNTRWDTLWSIIFGMSMGTGIWSMHFIGMMAFNLPIPVYYDITLTIISLLLAIIVCAIAVFPLRKGGNIDAVKIVYMGTLLGLGVTGMHYTGMAAMRMDASMDDSPSVVFLSIAIAIVAASAALFIANHVRAATIFSRLKLKIAAAIVMGLAVSSMHYTAMLGVHFSPVEPVQNLTGYIAPHFLASAAALMALLIQSGTFAGALLEEAYFTARASEKVAQERAKFDHALFSILELALEHRSLHEILDLVLNTLLNLDWLTFEKKGAVFIAGHGSDMLHMVAQRNLNPPLLDMCKQIEFGTCLCGQAAKFKTIIHKSCIDHDHSIMPEGMSPHGHYCIPILDDHATLGVLNLYVKHGHETSPLEIRFLESVGNAMAGIIKRKNAEELLLKMSYTDELTGLPNRRKFAETLDHALNIAKRGKSGLAVMMLDLDRFKPVNDAFGHDIGDILLQQASGRVLACLRDMDTLARIGGDEFIILLEMLFVPAIAADIGHRIVAELSRPFEIRGHHISVGGSIGVAMFPADGQSAEELIKQADIALYRAKETRGAIQINL